MTSFRRILLVGVLAALVSCLSAKPIAVTLETQVGVIEIEVLIDQAPISGASFLAHVDAGMLNDGGFYRTVYPENDNGSPKISVIQGGMLPDTEGLPPIAHETTTQTGILHRDGVISLARSEVGSATGGTFFICIGDQPSLDMGGGRAVSGDGQGFAAFGRVTKGMDVVKKIHRTKTNSDSDDAYTAGQIIAPPVRILKAYRQ
ncbi:MAG: peptidylprolyl isomerase [Opitutaceae bacterium]|jgi:peptidyl-prolyl cis-trans isomerase A (cyclophilin A)|nr:peptidylprolyl isomerase [Opitutaceae bacterium]